MASNLLSRWSSCTALAAALAISPFASAASPISGDNEAGVIDALHLGGTQLSTSQLGAIRGGFDVSPKLTISFGFQQVDSIGGKIIQSVMVPMTNLTQGTTTPAVIVTGGKNTTITTTTSNTQTTTASLSVPGSTSTVSGGGNSSPSTSSSSTPSVQPNTSPSVQSNTSNETTPSNTITIVPANAASITVSTKADNGQTVVLSQLGGSGITNVLANTQNNAILSQVTNMSIDITGMSQFLSQQAGSFASATGAFGNPAFSR